MIEEPYGIVYKITNIANGRIYVGQTTKSLGQRWRTHLWASTSPKFPIQYAIQKYGREGFSIEQLCVSKSQQELDLNEKFFAETLNAFAPSGYTLKAGNGRGSVSNETKEKQSKARKKENNSFFGKKHSKESILKMSQAHKGNTATLGKKRSKESCEKQGRTRAKTYYFISPEGDPITITNLRKFCREHEGKLHQGEMTQVFLGKTKYHKGWTKDISR